MRRVAGSLVIVLSAIAVFGVSVAARPTRSSTPKLLAPDSRLAPLPAAIRRGPLAFHFSPKPRASHRLSEVGGFRFYAIRGVDGYGCLLGADGRNSVGSCTPLGNFRNSPLITAIPAGNTMHYIGIAPAGYSAISIPGRRISFRHNWFAFSRPWGKFDATLRGKTVPSMHMRLGAERPT